MSCAEGAEELMDLVRVGHRGREAGELCTMAREGGGGGVPAEASECVGTGYVGRESGGEGGGSQEGEGKLGPTVEMKDRNKG
jgi:hypothetical protein